MRSSFFTLCGWPGLRWLLLSTFVLPCLADVRFTAPAAGAILKSGHIEVRWENSGINPPISELTQYTLSLMVGGNKDADMQPISTFESDGSFSDGNSAQGTIPEGIAADVKNGFFFRMTSTKEAGGVLINYSDRFSIPGLNGETALHIRQAAQALNGNTNGPPSVGNDSPAQSSTSAVSSTSTHLTSATSSTSVTTDVPSETPSTTRDSPETSATSTANAGNSSNGLSKGAIAGIAVGATVAIITLCAASVSFFWIRHRRKQQEVQEIVPGKPFHQKPVSELSDEHPLWPKRAWVRHRELSNDSMIHEAGSGERPPELDSMAFRAELEGSSPLSLK